MRCSVSCIHSIHYALLVEVRQEIASCAVQYRQNLCAESPIPAMLSQCSAWEACMNRDPSVIGRAKVSAELLAEVVNGFVEPISWKTLVSFPQVILMINKLLIRMHSSSHYHHCHSSQCLSMPSSRYTATNTIQIVRRMEAPFHLNQ